MPTPTLDRSQPFGEIFGDLAGRRSVQNGVYFDALDYPISDSNNLTAPAAKPKAKVPAKGAEPAPVDDPLAAQIAAQCGAS